MTIGRIPSVEGGIQPTIVDAKGDLIAATAADTVNRLAVGSNDQVLVADSSASTGLAWKSVATPFAAGKNKIINGDFNIWQRGTSFTTNGYTCDRFNTSASGGTNTFSRQAFTAGAAPVAGYESQYFMRIATSATATYFDIAQPIEDVRTFAGQTITFSFWAKASSSVGIFALARQFFGSGGSANVDHTSSTITLTTSWTRYSFTTTLSSLSGKTIGTGNALNMYLYYTSGTANSNNIDTWGWQVEAGNTATAFQTATGTLQGELAACQRYYQRVTSDVAYGMIGTGKAYTTGVVQITMPLKVTMRTTPTAIDTSAASTFIANTGATDVTSISTISINANLTNKDIVGIDVSKTSAFTVGAFYFLYANNSSTSYIGVTAEL